MFETDAEFRNKEREVWLSMPSCENGGFPEKSTSMFYKIYNVFGRTTSPSTKGTAKSEEAVREADIEREWDMITPTGSKDEGEEVWKERGDWVHVQKRSM